MKHEILKDVAMPARLFWAPITPAGVNIGIQLPLALFAQTMADINPLWFVFSTLFVHIFIVVAGIKEPHLSRLIEYSGKLKKFYGQKPVLLCDKYDYDNATILLKDFRLIIFKINNKLSEDSKAKYLKEIAKKEVCIPFLGIRFFYVGENSYLLLSVKKEQNINDAIQITLSSFSCELLTTASTETPSDVLKSILNPITDELFPAGSSLSENALLTNKRTRVKKELMRFEQNGKTAYTSVLSLQKLESSVDFDLQKLLDTDVSILEWAQPENNPVKIAFLLEQKRRLARLTSPNQSVQNQFLKAQEMLDGGEIFVSYGLNIYVSAESIQQLEAKKKDIMKKAGEDGMILTTEHLFLPFTFYMCLPHYDFPRQFLLSANDLE